MREKDKADDFIKNIEATIWFTNMLQNIKRDFKYKVVLKFYTVAMFFFFKGFSQK